MSTQTQRGHRPPPRPSRSPGAPPELTFQWESFRDISTEGLKLWKQHYAEIALDRDVCQLDPDWAEYHALDEAGVLRILTARSRNGSLVGYVFCRVGGHSHYSSTRFAHLEMFWLHPYFRKGWQPVKMFGEVLRGLKNDGVQIVTVNFKLHFKDGRVGKLLARLGFAPTDIVLRRRL